MVIYISQPFNTVSQVNHVMVRPLHALEWIRAQQYQCKALSWHRINSLQDIKLTIGFLDSQQGSYFIKILFFFSKISEHPNLPGSPLEARHPFVQQRQRRLLRRLPKVWPFFRNLESLLLSSSLIVYSDGTVEQIPPGIFQSTCKVGRRCLWFSGIYSLSRWTWPGFLLMSRYAISSLAPGPTMRAWY